MESFGLVALIIVLALAGLLIGTRLITFALRLARFSRLKRTSMVLPAVGPQPRPQSDGEPRSRFGARRIEARLPIELVAAHPTLPPERSSTAVHPAIRSTKRQAHRS
jgi:hypothetical protein